MAKKKPVNWTVIKTRYLQGEKPKDIAVDYGLTSKQVRDKAYLEDWLRQKESINDKIAIVVEDDLRTLCDVTLRVHTKFMQNLEGQIGEIQNPYLFDGERTNSLFQTAMNNSVKLMLAALKAKEDSEGGEDFPATEDVDPLKAMEAIKRITGD